MLKAKDIMTQKLITVSPETEITQAAKMLLDLRINGMPVVDDTGSLVGVICQSDIVAQQKRVAIPSIFTLLDSLIPITSLKSFERDIKKIAATKVVDVMTRKPATVGTEATVEEVATLMVAKNYHTIPVVEQGKLVGIIGKEDVLKTILSKAEASGSSQLP